MAGRASDLGGGNYSVNRIGPQGARALAASRTLSALSQLSLDYNGLGDEGIEALAASRTLRRLEVLSLVANDLSDEGFKLLAVSDVLDTVAVLDLGHTSSREAILARFPRAHLSAPRKA